MHKIAFDLLVSSDSIRIDKDVGPLVESFCRNGYDENYPLVVSLQDDGRYLVVCGHRRFNALLWLRDLDPLAFDRVLLGGKVPCVVYTNLTEKEETDFRVFGMS